MKGITDNRGLKSFIYDILIVDSDKFTITVLEEYFGSKGYIIKGVVTGTQGLEELKKNVPKLILLSIMLPDINGYEVCKTIKSNKKLKNILIYYITTFPKAYVLEKIEYSGADGCFLKPFKFKEFEILFNYI